MDQAGTFRQCRRQYTYLLHMYRLPATLLQQQGKDKCWQYAHGVYFSCKEKYLFCIVEILSWQPQVNALIDYWHGEHHAVLTIKSILGTADVPVDIYFRDTDAMPMAELYALDLCQSPVLEIGAGSGSHALALQALGHTVTALDIDPSLAWLMKSRGVIDAKVGDFWTLPEGRYQTLLFMMNGIGLAGHLSQLSSFLEKCDALLSPGGQVLFDSTDLAINVPGIAKKNPANYYGELQYQLGYKNRWGHPFSWLYVDMATLRQVAEEAGWRLDIGYEGDDGHYLGRLTRA